MMKRVLLSWSSGKDSAWALHVLRHDPTVEVAALLTTVNETFDRVAMHAVRRPLVELQAKAAGLPLWTIPLPWPCSNEIYEACMRSAIDRAVMERFTHVAFGDLFLEDVRRYREDRLRGSGVAPLFPLWGKPTEALAREMVRAGLKARLSCVDPKLLDPAFAAREYDATLLSELPAGVDPCGERGEFHTFAYEGPMFNYPISIITGEVVTRDGFVFADFRPNPNPQFPNPEFQQVAEKIEDHH